MSNSEKIDGKQALARIEAILNKPLEEKKARLEALLVECRVNEIEDPVERKREEQKITKRFWAIEAVEGAEMFSKMLREDKELRAFINKDKGFTSIIKEMFRPKKK